MTEFTSGIYKSIKRLIIETSVGRAVIYTFGHIIIAMTCNRLITGADWFLAGMDALIEPIINGFWYYFLDKFWTSKMKDKNLDNQTIPYKN